MSQTFDRYVCTIEYKYNHLNLGASWGDYDNDGIFELFTIGRKFIDAPEDQPQCKNTLFEIVKNQGLNNAFIENQETFTPGIWEGDIKWCDFNNDNILDLIIVGEEKPTLNTYQNSIQFYKGTAGTGFQLVNMNEVACGKEPVISISDFDNDGYQDLCISDPYGIRIYKNGLNVNNSERDFHLIKTILSGNGFYVYTNWTDIDLDGYPELFVYSSSSTGSLMYYKYDSENDDFIANTAYIRKNGQYYNFPEISAQFVFADFNNDNYSDMLIAKLYNSPSANCFTRLYVAEHDDSNYPIVFTEEENIIEDNTDNQTGQFTQFQYSWVSVGDLDNNETFDIFISGTLDEKVANKGYVYINNNITGNDLTGKFVENNITSSYGQLSSGSSQFGDWDDDGDLDIIYEGYDCHWPNCSAKTVLLDNLLNPTSPPVIPQVTGTFNSDCVPIIGITDKAKVTLSWGAVANAKSYNVYLTDANGQIFGAPMAFPYSDPNNGYRMVPQPGNATASDFPAKIFVLPFGTYNWWVQVIDARYKGSEFAYGGSFQLAECPISNTPLEINEDETWTENRVLYKNLIVRTGSKLIIQATISFAVSAKLIVEKGAKLILDNGTLTNACLNEFWGGIEVNGNEQASQIPYFNSTPQAWEWDQGIIEIINGGTIENAICGIKTVETDNNGNEIYGTYGGIIKADNAVFRNNKIAVQFYRYDNFIPSNNQSINNVSHFMNCQFITDKNINPNIVPDAFIKLQGVKGIAIAGCEFKNNTTSSTANDNGNGIVSDNAGFYATSCEHYVGGNLVTTKNHFEGLNYGIWASGSAVLPITIENNEFENNYCGVATVGIKNAKINKNGFDEGSFGMGLLNSTGYEVMENIFGSASTINQSVGIIIDESGNSTNLIYKNTFQNTLTYSIGVEGTNGFISNIIMRSNLGGISAPVPPYLYSGLEFKCNTFNADNSMFDILIWPDAAISPFQGKNIMPAGNQFLKPPAWLQNIAVLPNALPFSYFYYNSNYDENPHITPDINYQKLGCSTQNTCNSNLSGNTPTQLYATINGSLHALKSMTNKIDEGKTPELVEKTRNANTQNGLTFDELRGELIKVSPYVSDTVLINVIEKFDTVETSKLKDVMVANSPLTKRVKTILDAKALPDSIKQSINAAQTGVSARWELEARINDTMTMMGLAENELMRQYLNDTTYSGIDSVINYQIGKHNYDSKKILVEAYYEKGDVENLASAIDSLEIYNKADTLFKEYFQLMADLMSDDITIFEIDSSQEQTVRDIAATKTEAGAYAKGLLAIVYGEIPPIELEDFNFDDSLNIVGQLLGPICAGSFPVVGDTIAIMDTTHAIMQNINPIVTDTMGCFTFEFSDLMQLGVANKYAFVSKDGKVFQDTVYKTISEWIEEDTVRLRLQKIKADFSYDTILCLGMKEHFIALPRYGQSPYTYNWYFVLSQPDSLDSTNLNLNICQSFAKDTTIIYDSTSVNYIYAETGAVPVLLMVTDNWGCVDTIIKSLDYLVTLNTCPTIRGNVYESFDCGGSEMANDTLIIIDKKKNKVKSISPSITNDDGYFKFDFGELYNVYEKDTGALYNIVGKSGFELDYTAPQTLKDWILDSQLNLSSAPVHQQWVAKYIGPDSLNDFATALDLNQNIYVVGSSRDSTGDQFAVIKYDSTGTQKWVARLDEAYPNVPLYMTAITVDSLANVIIAGRFSVETDTGRISGLILYKIDPDGEILWVNVYDDYFWVNSAAKIIGLYTCKFANIIVGCSSYDNKGFIISKYKKDGTPIWAIDNNSLGYSDISINSMVVDEVENAYLSGKYSTDWENNGCFVTLKINENGGIIIGTIYPEDFDNSNLVATSNVIDKNNNIYVTGLNLITLDSIITIKYNSFGDTLWVRSCVASDLDYESFSGKLPNKILIDDDNNTFVYGSAFNGENTSLYMIKYDSLGNRLWYAGNLNYNNNSYNEIKSAILGNDGSIYITGTTGSFDEENSFLNYITAKISENGLEWTTVYKGDSNRASATCIKVSSNGNVYVTGGSKWLEGRNEYATIKYAQCPSKANLRNHSLPSNTTTTTENQILKVYPNPAKDEFTIEYSGDVNGQMMATEVYNIYGALVKEVRVGNKNKFTVSTRDLPSGIYYYRVRLGNSVVGKDKIVIMK